MKRIKLILLPILLLIVCACSRVDSRSSIIADNIDSSKYDTSKYSYVTCTRDTTTTNGEDVVIKYEAYYDKNKYLQVLKRHRKLMSEKLHGKSLIQHICIKLLHQEVKCSIQNIK